MCNLLFTKNIYFLMRTSSESTPIHFPNWIASQSPDGSNSLLRRNKTRYDKNIRFHKALVSWHVILYYLRDIIPFVCDSFPRFVSLNESVHTKRDFRQLSVQIKKMLEHILFLQECKHSLCWYFLKVWHLIYKFQSLNVKIQLCCSVEWNANKLSLDPFFSLYYVTHKH